jgi:hypothetical protein
MSPLAWAVAGALAGLGAALALVRNGLLPAWLVRSGPSGNGRGGPPASPGPASSEVGTGGTVCVRLAYDDLKLIRDDIRDLHVVRTDLQRVGDLLERLLEEAMAFQRARLDPPRPEPAGGSARDAFREPVRDPSPVRGATWRQGGRGLEMEVRHDEHAGGFDPNYPTRTRPAGDPAYPAPAAALPREPPADAVYVEATNDTVAPSVRHPPEAWLERRGGDGEVWLNSRVTLADPALQRWSTFFDWERREPGARYQALRPAVVTWSGDSGILLRKGVARPL